MSGFDNDLHLSVRYGELTQVYEALDRHLCPNEIGLYQWSALHEASSNGFTDIVRALLKYGGDPNAPDRLCANTAVHYAAQGDHSQSLRILLEAGGRFDLPNNDGNTAAELASRSCLKVIEKSKVEALMSMSIENARKEAQKEIGGMKAAKDDQLESQKMCDGQPNLDIQIKEISQNRHKAWSPQITESAAGTMGQMQLSFEYHSKKSTLRVRLWKVTGLMFSPKMSTMIQSLFVKSSFVPDESRTSKRKSEEIKLAPLLTTETGAGTIRVTRRVKSYVTDDGKEEPFHPVTVKFTKPLVYDRISSQEVAEKVFLLQVCVKRKYTGQTYKVADLTLPLNVAVTKIVKESFPLRKHPQMALPDSMMIIPEQRLNVATGSDSNIRHHRPITVEQKVRPHSDADLKEVVSVSSTSPSISLDIPDEDWSELERHHLQEIDIVNHPPADTCVPMPGFVSEDDGAANTVPTVPSPQVHVTVTSDSDESDSETDHHRNQRPTLTKLMGKLKLQTPRHDAVIELGSESTSRSSGGPVNHTLAILSEVSLPMSSISPSHRTVFNHQVSSDSPTHEHNDTVLVDLEQENLELCSTYDMV